VKEKSYSFDTFAIGRANQLAYLSVKRTLKNLGKEINPLFLHSKRGLGKTHLMRALKNALADEKVLLVDGEEGASIPENDHTVLILENLHLFPETVRKGKELCERIQSYISRETQVYITSLLPPDELSLSEDLTTVLKGGLEVPIFRPEPELIGRIFKMLSGNLELNLSDEVIDFLSGLPFSDIREIETSMKKIDLLRDLTDNITVDDVKGNVAFEEIVSSQIETSEQSSTDSEFYNFLKGLKEDVDSGTTDSKVSSAIKDEYMQKLYIWKMKGFNVRRLEQVMEDPIDTIIQEFVSFTSNVQRLIELQKLYGEIESITTKQEKEYFEKALFDPEAIFDITKKLMGIEQRKKMREEYRKFLDRKKTSKNFVILPSNREAFMILKKTLTEDENIEYPICIHGKRGYGKTHLLMAFSRRMQDSFPEKIVSYIPSEVLNHEIESVTGEKELDKLFGKLRRIDYIFIDDIEEIVKNEGIRVDFMEILRIFKKEEKRFILSSELHPNEFTDDTIRNYFLSGTVISLKKLTPKDIQMILTNLFAVKKIPLSDEIKEFLSENLEGTFSDIKKRTEVILRKIMEENLEFSLKSIEKFVDAKPREKEARETVKEKEEEKIQKEGTQKEPSVVPIDDEVFLEELDYRWPFLEERIFEDHITE
jgi:chromosomal replication initiation ATPase DnaA